MCLDGNPGLEDTENPGRTAATERSLNTRKRKQCGRILALPESRLEVYRDPAGDGYRSVTHRAAGDEFAPLARPYARIVVDDLLP